MIRKEEIQEAAKACANQYANPVEWHDAYRYFIKGAEWADKHPRKNEPKHTCNNCKTFKTMRQNCPYSPIFQYPYLSEAKKHLDDETDCKFYTSNLND